MLPGPLHGDVKQLFPGPLQERRKKPLEPPAVAEKERHICSSKVTSQWRGGSASHATKDLFSYSWGTISLPHLLLLPKEMVLKHPQNLRWELFRDGRLPWEGSEHGWQLVKPCKGSSRKGHWKIQEFCLQFIFILEGLKRK